MLFTPQFLDEVRARTTLSALIGRSIKLDKAGREFRACCPFHSEKSPSFTVNDAKGFAHCFGCGWHGDAFRWLADHDGAAFVDAVRDLATAAGLALPVASPEAVQQSQRVEGLRGALDAAQAIYARQLAETGAVLDYLAGRGVGPEQIGRFGIGYARGGDGSLRGSGIGQKPGVAAGLIAASEDGSLREMFYDRITIPIHDARGRLCGFGARVWPGRGRPTSVSPPKFINSPENPLFDKGNLLFNLHRAAPLARAQAANRLIVVEGYFDVVALDRAGIGEAVAPMGTALTEAQLTRLWRHHHRPVLLFDGDAAGRRAAVRACRLALAQIGPGHELAVALLPEGKDPDDLLRVSPGGVGDSGGAGDFSEAGRRAIEAAIAEAAPVHRFLFDALAHPPAAEGDGSANVRPAGSMPGALARSPEQVSAIWRELSELGGAIADADARAEYLAVWRARFEREVSAVPQVLAGEPLHSFALTAEGDYAFPESESDSAARLIALVRALLKRREERRAINDEIRDLMSMAEMAGFHKVAITSTVKDIEADLQHGPEAREEAEMNRVLYRRVLGVRGPLSAAMLPQLVEGRARVVPVAVRRRAAMHALIDAGGVAV